MIPERYKVQAKRIDNGELICGSLILDAFIDAETREPLYYIFNCNNSDSDCFEDMSEDMEYFRVDPTTIEPVAVEVISDCAFGKCPNCHGEFNSELQSEYNINFCPWCGQRLSW